MTISIVDAMNDPALFGAMFADESWDRWRVFLAALFALPMDDDALATYRHHTGRTEPPTVPFREAALICGRRGGKSRILGLCATFLAVFRDYSAHIAPGEVPTVAIIAADRKQARVILRYVTGLFRAVPLLEQLIQDELAESVTLTNRVAIEIHTGSIGAPRGRSFIAVLCDEIAFWKADEASAKPDAEVVNAVRPGLASIPGSMLLMASSPYAKRGLLWSAYRRHWGRDESKTLIWRGSTQEMNSRIDPDLIAAAREEDPASAAAEYDAQFRDDISAFVSREIIAECTVAGRFELPPRRDVRYEGFTDPSGGSSDSMTLAIAHREGETAVLDCIREVRPPFSPEAVVAEFAQTLKSYGIRRVRGDRYGGEWPAERFQAYGIKYEPADKPKSDIYRDCLPLLNARRVELLDHPRLASQLAGLERRTARGGRDSIDHPPNAHDDIANSVAGALLFAAAPGPRPAYTISFSHMLR